MFHLAITGSHWRKTLSHSPSNFCRAVSLADCSPSAFLPPARTYDNLDACEVVQSASLITAASLLEVSGSAVLLVPFLARSHIPSVVAKLRLSQALLAPPALGGWRGPGKPCLALHWQHEGGCLHLSWVSELSFTSVVRNSCFVGKSP